jgi:glycosyltransferase involved in cell wall biosynthesis
MRLGYAPYDHGLDAPGDRRRFVSWAKDRNVEFELLDEPRAGIDMAVVSTAADLTRWRRAPRRMRVIYDLTDDYLGLPSGGLKNRARGVAKFLSGEISRPTLRFRQLMIDMCRRAEVVVCTSEAQRAHVQELSGHNDVRLILDCYDAATVDRKREYRLAWTPRLVWEGLPFNVATLGIVRDALEALPSDLSPSVHIVTQTRFHPFARRFGTRSSRSVATGALPHADVALHEWRQDTVAGDVTACDVAIIPLDLADGFASSKSAQKLISLWAMGMPVVTSATAAYEAAMREAGTGELACRTAEEWTSALTALLSDETARRDAARAGRAYVERCASREIMLARWDELLR